MKKFAFGDHARIASPRRGKTAFLRYHGAGIRPGRIVIIKEVRPARHQGKCYYRIGTNYRRGDLWMRSDDLLRPEDNNLRGGARKGAGRPSKAEAGSLNK